MDIIFWEKPGCMGNAKQKALLTAAGHDVVAKSLPGHSWTREELAPFFEGLEVGDWFNRGARRVQEGEVMPDGVDEETAYKILLADPILVRRPLLQIGEDRCVGFDLAWIEARVGALPGIEGPRKALSAQLSQCSSPAAACTPTALSA